MNVRFIHVTSLRGGPASKQFVVALADDHLVKLSRRDGWTCNCDTEGDQCDHVDAVEALLDDRVARHGWGDE